MNATARRVLFFFLPKFSLRKQERKNTISEERRDRVKFRPVDVRARVEEGTTTTSPTRGCVIPSMRKRHTNHTRTHVCVMQGGRSEELFSFSSLQKTGKKNHLGREKRRGLNSGQRSC